MIFNVDDLHTIESLIFSRIVVLTEVVHIYKSKKAKGYPLDADIAHLAVRCDDELNILCGLIEKMEQLKTG